MGGLTGPSFHTPGNEWLQFTKHCLSLLHPGTASHSSSARGKAKCASGPKPPASPWGRATGVSHHLILVQLKQGCGNLHRCTSEKQAQCGAMQLRSMEKLGSRAPLVGSQSAGKNGADGRGGSPLSVGRRSGFAPRAWEAQEM